jgi:hypothetical protein
MLYFQGKKKKKGKKKGQKSVYKRVKGIQWLLKIKVDYWLPVLALFFHIPFYPFYIHNEMY